jgi:hypothetical protein
LSHSAEGHSGHRPSIHRLHGQARRLGADEIADLDDDAYGASLRQAATIAKSKRTMLPTVHGAESRSYDIRTNVRPNAREWALSVGSELPHLVMRSTVPLCE